MSISKKIFIFSCIALLFIILPLFYIARSALSQFGIYAYDVNEKQIRQSARFYLSVIADERAGIYDEIFNKINTAASIMGSGLTQMYQMADAGRSAALTAGVVMDKNPENGIFYSPAHEPVITLYWGADRLSGRIRDEIGWVRQFAPILQKTKEKVPESLATHVITTSGIGCYFTDDQKARSACFDLLPPSRFDIRDGEPLTMFTRSKTRYFDTRWTRIYKDDVIDDLMMTASAPVYDAQKTIRGITGIDLPVGYIIRDMIGSIAGSGNIEGGILFSFLLNREGNIIAFPKEHLELFGLDVDVENLQNSSDIFSHSLNESSLPQVRRLTRQILEGRSGLIDVSIAGEQYLMASGSLTSVGWHLVCVARESDLAASLKKTRIALEDSLTNIWKDFLAHSALITLACVLMIFSAIKIFIAPIRQFISASNKIAKGDLSINVDVNRGDEIGQLADAFNIMIQKLKLSESNEKQHAKELELRINSRTEALEQSNRELNRIRSSLEKTVAKRTVQLKKLNEHLVFTEESERKAISSDLHDSVSQTLAMCISKLKDIQDKESAGNRGNLKEIQQFLEQSLREIRSLIYQLSPPILDDFDIEIALGFLIEEINSKHHSRFEYVNNIEDPQQVDHAIKITIYRAVSELITNILKHSGTKTGRIQIAYVEKEAIRLSVADPGVGFDPKSIALHETYGFGLKSLSERIHNFGGTVLIRSSEGEGTDICLTVPIRMNKEIGNEPV